MSRSGTGSGTTPARPGWVRRLGAVVLRRRRDVALALGAALLGSACQAVVPLIARHIVDDVILSPRSRLWPWLGALIGVAVLAFGLAYVRRYRGGRVALGAQYDLRNLIHDHLQTLDAATLSGLPTGQLVARANSDSALVQGLLSFLPLLSLNVLQMFFALGIMLWLSPLLAVVAFVVLPLLTLLSYRMRSQVFPASWDAQQREGDVAQIVDEDVSGVRVVKAFGQERREVERMAATARLLYGSKLRAVRLQARYQPLLESVPTLAQVSILVLGGWLALRGRISIGTFLAFSTYVSNFAAPARQVAGILTVGQQARAGVERIFQLLDLEPAITDGPTTLGPVRGALSFRDVEFGHPGGPPVLRGLDLELAAGERVAVIGASGSGKSTLAMLVGRFADPTAGSVSVDGHDLRSVTLPSLRGQVGYAFEESFLFSDSVRANIVYGRPDSSDDEVFAAARAAGADGFIRALPDGYATTIGERGLTLSGGQRQRIALARVILADPRILVLDDATSAVDARTEEAIHDALREVLAGRTTLLVAHRLSTLGLADRVVVLDDGRIVESGTHTELFERSVRYRSLLAGLDAPDEEHGDAQHGIVPSVAAGPRSLQVSAPARTFRAGPTGLGAGLGGGGAHGGNWRLGLAPTPELLEKVAALRPLRDDVPLDLATEAAPEPDFSMSRLLRRFRRPLLFGLLLVVLDAAAGLLGPALVKAGIDHGVLAGAQDTLLLAGAAFAVITVLDLGVLVAQTFVVGRVAERIMLSLRVRIWAQLQRLSLDYYEREMGGRIMTRMTTDVDAFESLITNGLLSALVAFVTFVGVGVALLVIDVPLGACTLLVVLPLAVATAVFRSRSARLYDRARERLAVVNAGFQESVSGIREAQAFGHEARTVAHFHRLGRDYLDVRVAAQRLVALYFPFVQFLSACADAIVLGVGAFLVSRGSMTAGVLIAFILYIDLFFSPIQQLSQVFDAWQQTRVSVGRIAELMRLRPLTPETENPVVPGRLGGRIALEGVRFAYPAAVAAAVSTATGNASAPEALRGIDLHIAPGETVALVGETGAGKSTVLKLLARFYDPDAGAVTVDGRDLRTLDLSGYRHQLGYVPQEAFLFGGSVRDNIAYGRPDASDAEVEAAARAVGAHDVVTGLSGGYEHVIGERGASLSSGQRQLIALARAELVDPAVLLLDEATSNLDLATEARVAAAMRRVASSRTTLVIAHRLQTARTADRIVVLADGCVAESGSHDELLARDGAYAAMWRAFEH